MALAGCTRAPAPKPDEIRPVRVIRIADSVPARAAEFAGEVRARHETRLAFRVPGKVTERLVEVGTAVRAGQAMARLDPADLLLAIESARAQAASARAELDLAAAELRRAQDLRERNFISAAELDRRAGAAATANARHEAMLAQQRQATNQAGYAVLAADAAGVVLAIEAEAGQVVAAGQTVVRLARDGEKEVAFAVPESRRGLASAGSAFEVTLNAYPGKSWQARLRELAPAADPLTRTYAARATLVAPGPEIELGMSVRIAVTAADRPARIELPVAALHSRGDVPQVLLVGADGTTRLQPVKTAGLSGERIVIESGLAAGDVVVAAGASLLRPGQKVRVLE